MTDKIPFYIYCCLKNCFGSLAAGCVTSDLICYLLHSHFGCTTHFDLSKSGRKAFYHFNRSKSSFRLAVRKKIGCWHCCFDPFSVFLSEGFTYATAATNTQFTYAANTSCMPWKNDKLPTESTFLLR